MLSHCIHEGSVEACLEGVLLLCVHLMPGSQAHVLIVVPIFRRKKNHILSQSTRLYRCASILINHVSRQQQYTGQNHQESNFVISKRSATTCRPSRESWRAKQSCMEVLWGVGVCHSACMHSLVHLYMVDWVLADSARLSQTLQMRWVRNWV